MATQELVSVLWPQHLSLDLGTDIARPNRARDTSMHHKLAVALCDLMQSLPTITMYHCQCVMTVLKDLCAQQASVIPQHAVQILSMEVKSIQGPCKAA